jgi:hypothetical protein
VSLRSPRQLPAKSRLSWPPKICLELDEEAIQYIVRALTNLAVHDGSRPSEGPRFWNWIDQPQHFGSDIGVIGSITNAAMNIVKAGGSLRDVQELAGHTSLATTQRYIQGDTEAKRNVIKLI